MPVPLHLPQDHPTTLCLRWHSGQGVVPEAPHVLRSPHTRLSELRATSLDGSG